MLNVLLGTEDSVVTKKESCPHEGAMLAKRERN